MPRAPKAPKTDRRILNLPNFDAVVSEARRLHESGYQSVGQWDLAQACRHCVTPINGCLNGFGFKASWFVCMII